ncbi:protein DYAD-like [Canna indica]|uniref:Protein DYAD-like n=1 Tax=Canna indica TaxID=4628 RepID=A0AAQ3Q403_9LILI|nr:protein DYAD-like [Canna indica]
MIRIPIRTEDEFAKALGPGQTRYSGKETRVSPSLTTPAHDLGIKKGHRHRGDPLVPIFCCKIGGSMTDLDGAHRIVLTSSPFVRRVYGNHHLFLALPLSSSSPLLVIDAKGEEVEDKLEEEQSEFFPPINEAARKIASSCALCDLIDRNVLALLCFVVFRSIRLVLEMETPWEKGQVKYYYSKRNDSMSKERKSKWALSRQALPDANSSHASPCKGGIFELGAFYEIDHEKLPPKSPIQLKAIRIVKVSEATTLEVTVSFPSTLALRNYFALSPEPGRDPELDERFVMSSNQAGRILQRRVPPSELDERKHLDSFWLSSPNLHELASIVVPPASVSLEEDVDEQLSPVGHCLLTIKRAGLVGWGIRRKVKYIGRQREASSPEQEEAEDEVEPDEEVEQQSSERKRKREIAEEEKKKKKKKKGKKKEKQIRGDKEIARGYEEQKHGRGTKERWSTERYEAAELRLLEIMKEKGAALGKPIMRQALREEARKHIGDTGLLDHLLKHMAGKVVTNGTERFRRRHNSEGAMEYWLEPADLVEVREKAGVSDPYWVPPPGWKPGDATSACHCGSEWKTEILNLREQIKILKSDIEQLKPWIDIEMEANQTEVAKGCDSTCEENYNILLEKHNKLEEEICVISNCFKGLREEFLVSKEAKESKMEIEVTKEDKGLLYEAANDDAEKQEAEKNEKKWDGDINNSSSTTNDNNCNSSSKSNQSISGAVGTDNKSKSGATNSKRWAARRSGFKICKPQGTFLWPDMWSNGGAGGGGVDRRPQGPLVVPNNAIVSATTTMTTAAIEEHLMLLGGVPTPNSASSATSAPRLLLLPTPTSPVLTRSSDVMAVPPPPPAPYHDLHLQPTDGSHNICPSVVYHHMVARVWAHTTTSPTALSGAGGPEGNNKIELAAIGSREAHKGGGRSSIITDLALATPSSTSY